MVIVGATKTGKSIHNFLKLRDIPHSIVDTRDNASFIEDDSEEFLSIVKFGKEKVKEAIANADEVYFSPSIDQTEFEIPKEKIKSELNLFLTFSKHFTIGITGTNGKSTVCYFISQLLDSLEVPNEIIGNFGLPMINGLSEDLNKVLIVELSSFQLEDASNSSLPNLSGLNIAGFINFSEDHLDRHTSEEAYLNAKKCIEKKIKPNGVFLYNQAYIATHPSYSQKGIPVGKENLGYNYRQLAECLAFEFNDQEIARTTQKLSAINAENLLFAIGVVHQLFIHNQKKLDQQAYKAAVEGNKAAGETEEGAKRRASQLLDPDGTGAIDPPGATDEEAAAATAQESIDEANTANQELRDSVNEKSGTKNGAYHNNLKLKYQKNPMSFSFEEIYYHD